MRWRHGLARRSIQLGAATQPSANGFFGVVWGWQSASQFYSLIWKRTLEDYGNCVAEEGMVVKLFDKLANYVEEKDFFCSTDSINQTVSDVLGGDSAQNFDVQNYVGTSRVLGFTMIVAVVDVVLITAISTLGAFLYNLAAALLGGVEVTLAEDEH